MPPRLGTFDAPVLMPYVEKSAVPSAPIINSATSDDTGWGGSLEFTVKAEDIDGNYIDENKLFYSIFFDEAESPYSFYDQNGDPMTEIPCTYTDGNKFFIYSGVHYIIGIPVQYKKVGIQAINKSGGEVKRSTTTWFILKPSGVDEVTTRKQVTGVSCYDLSGRPVTQDTTGIYIKVTTFSDGSRKTVKIVH